MNMQRNVILCAAAAILLMTCSLSAESYLGSDLFPDIVVSHYSVGYNSYIYYGDGSRSFARDDVVVYNSGTARPVANSVNDLDGDGFLDIVFPAYGPGISHIYWGDPDIPYDFASRTPIQTDGTHNLSTADMDKDGFVDIVFSCNNAGSSSYIYWGAANDNNPYSSRSDLDTGGAARANAVADMDGDGFLDVVMKDKVFWGSASRNYSGSTSLPSLSGEGYAVGDLNNDGKADIVGNVLYYGAGNNSFTLDPSYALTSNQGLLVADINSDGWMDIVAPKEGSGAGTYIYWGASVDPFSTASRTLLPYYSGAGLPQSAAAGDLDKDGFADIVIVTVQAKGYVYWGDPSHSYSTATELLPGAGGSYIFEGVSVIGSPGWYGANQGLGDALPLWVTRDGFGTDVVYSWQYEFIGLKNELLNDGALDLNDEEVATLADLFLDGKKGLNPGPVGIDGMNWSYYGNLITTGAVNAGNYARTSAVSTAPPPGTATAAHTISS